MPSCLVLDVSLPGVSGLDLQQELAKSDVRVPIIFLTGHGDIPMTVRAVKAGAANFLTKPFDGDELLNAIRQCITSHLEDEVQSDQKMRNMVGESAQFRAVLKTIQLVAPTDATVLIQGETGTGKELVARAIHELSSRSERPFVMVNCAAIPATLLESELFGHEKGAFTGAFGQKLGRYELAHQGTLFLDEIGDIPLELQPKLLRVLQQQEFERLGGNRTIRVDVRLIAATNRALEEMIIEKQFRLDLYYRLNVFPIFIPPLRERPEDIPLLVRHFVRQFSRRMNKRMGRISPETMEALIRYPWPGNIRELQNVIERSVVIYKKGDFSVNKSWLSCESFQFEPATQTLFRRSSMEEREIIGAALAETRGRVSGPFGAAARLGIPPSTLESKIRSMNIDKYRFKASRSSALPSRIPYRFSRSSRIREESAAL
jgi:DNA-binding NtrC family response regulator